MTTPRLILLPGLDGTGDLFQPFLSLIPATWNPLIIRYPLNDPLTYPQLLDDLESQLPADVPLVLLAESFSGPIAIEYAARHPGRVRGLILIASFIQPPMTRVMAALVREQLFRFPFPNFLARRYLAGPTGDVTALKAAIKKVAPVVMTTRIKMILNIDVREAVRATHYPILYIAAKDDMIVRPRCMYEIREIRPDLEMTIIHGPHLLLQSNPHDAWLAIEPFLQRSTTP